MESKLVVGLGNPGTEYEETYHNVGKLFIDYLAGKETHFKKTKHFEYTDLQLTDLQTYRLILVKPLNFMNQSGAAVAAAKKYFKAKPKDILIIHDDSDIPLGSFKLSFSRGSAGHQGAASIIKSLRTNKFYRLRVGTRSIKKRGAKAGDFVLKKISPADLALLYKAFAKIKESFSKEKL